MEKLLAMLFRELLGVIVHEIIKILKEPDTVAADVKPDLGSLNVDADSINVDRFAGL